MTDDAEDGVDWSAVDLDAAVAEFEASAPRPANGAAAAPPMAVPPPPPPAPPRQPNRFDGEDEGGLIPEPPGLDHSKGRTTDIEVFREESGKGRVYRGRVPNRDGYQEEIRRRWGEGVYHVRGRLNGRQVQDSFTIDDDDSDDAHGAPWGGAPYGQPFHPMQQPPAWGGGPPLMFNPSTPYPMPIHESHNSGEVARLREELAKRDAELARLRDRCEDVQRQLDRAERDKERAEFQKDAAERESRLRAELGGSAKGEDRFAAMLQAMTQQQLSQSTEYAKMSAEERRAAREDAQRQTDMLLKLFASKKDADPFDLMLKFKELDGKNGDPIKQVGSLLGVVEKLQGFGGGGGEARSFGDRALDMAEPALQALFKGVGSPPPPPLPQHHYAPTPAVPSYGHPPQQIAHNPQQAPAPQQPPQPQQDDGMRALRQAVHGLHSAMVDGQPATETAKEFHEWVTRERQYQIRDRVAQQAPDELRDLLGKARMFVGGEEGEKLDDLLQRLGTPEGDGWLRQVQAGLRVLANGGQATPPQPAQPEPAPATPPQPQQGATP